LGSDQLLDEQAEETAELLHPSRRREGRWGRLKESCCRGSARRHR
jgi:hypothetical protein